MSIPDAWTTERVDFNGKARIVNLVTGIKDVGSARVKNLSKPPSGSSGASRSRSQKFLQLKAKHFSDKPVVRISSHDDKHVAKGPMSPGAYFMPSENPTTTLLTQINVGTNRLTESQTEYLESLHTKSPSANSRGVPIVNVACGGFFTARGVLNDIPVTKVAFTNESPPLERKQTTIRKSLSMSVRQNGNTAKEEQSVKPRPLVIDSANRGPGNGGKSLCYHESFKSGGDLLPVFDKSELDASNDYIDLLLPGVVSDVITRTVQCKQAQNSRTAPVCSCGNQGDGTGGNFPFLLPGTTPTLNRKSTRAGSNTESQGGPPQCECKQRHDDETNSPPKKLVQYRHGDVIKTFDWLTADSQETAL